MVSARVGGFFIAHLRCQGHGACPSPGGLNAPLASTLKAGVAALVRYYTSPRHGISRSTRFRASFGASAERAASARTALRQIRADRELRPCHSRLNAEADAAEAAAEE